MNYEDLIFLIKSYFCELFFCIQHHLSNGRKNFNGNIQPPHKLPLIKVDYDIAQGEKGYFKSSIYANIHR